MDVDPIIDLWPTMTDMAEDLKIDPATVRKWKARAWIPPKYDFDIVTAARSRGKVISLETIALIRKLGESAD